LEVIDRFLRLPVIIVFQTLLDRAHIHWFLNDFVIIGQVQLDGVDGLMKGPTELVFPHELHDVFGEEVKLICLSTGTTWMGLHWRLNDSVHGFDGNLDEGRRFFANIIRRR
jgi:hypothetical protein